MCLGVQETKYHVFVLLNLLLSCLVIKTLPTRLGLGSESSWLADQAVEVFSVARFLVH